MRILSWNTLWRFSDFEPRQPRIVAAVAARQPDLVLLQETWPEQAEAIASACGLAVIAYDGGAFDPPINPATAGLPFGNAILGSPDTTGDVAALPLPKGDDPAHRVGVSAVSTLLGPPVLLVSTHLTHLSDHGPIRGEQMERLAAWADGRTPDGATVLGGDLNQVPTSDEFTAAVAPNWLDLWAAAHPDGLGLTMVADNPLIERDDWLIRPDGLGGGSGGVRFDFLLARHAGRPGLGGLALHHIELMGAADDGWPSDHLGLVADIEISDSESGL
ncbi:MAG: endonuclease/exonuclease/phosphatase family protein [Actinomycetota bacterium]